MIKFRCPCCGQKLAVNDEGADAVILCPTCAERIVVPPAPGAGIRPLNGRPASPSAIALRPLGERHWQQRLLAAEQQAQEATALVRAGLLPHLARWMANKLVQALLSQRAHLLDTQHTAALQVVELEHRLVKVQEQVESRLQSYQTRIAELEGELAAKEQENRELLRGSIQTREEKQEPEPTRTRRPGRVDLREASFLLRA